MAALKESDWFPPRIDVNHASRLALMSNKEKRRKETERHRRLRQEKPASPPVLSERKKEIYALRQRIRYREDVLSKLRARLATLEGIS